MARKILGYYNISSKLLDGFCLDKGFSKAKRDLDSGCPGEAGVDREWPQDIVASTGDLQIERGT